MSQGRPDMQNAGRTVKKIRLQKIFFSIAGR